MLESGRRFSQLSLPRFAGWGALGGLLLFGAFFLAVSLAEGFVGELLFSGPVFMLAGAGSAAGTLAVARRGADRDRIEARAQADEVGLTDL